MKLLATGPSESPVVRASQAKISPQTARNPIPQMKIGNVSQNFVTIDDMNFTNTLKKIVIGAVILKTVLIIFVHNIFTLLVINNQNVKEISAGMNFPLTKSTE